MQLEPLLELATKFGVFALAAVGLWYAVLTPRKTHDGQRRSSLLVPGWIHDEQTTEMERRARALEVAVKDEQERGIQRIGEWRALRDEEIARRADAEADAKQLLEAVNGLVADVAVLLELQGSTTRRRRATGDTSAAPHR
jgi:hypothetical protein